MTARANFVRPMGVVPPIEPRFQAILDESNAAAQRVIEEHHASLSRMASPLTTDDSETVAQIVDQLKENPFAFACSYVNLTRFVKQMHRDLMELREQVNGLSAREAI